jgi:hypothetical protein
MLIDFTTKPKTLKVDFTPLVYMQEKTHSYLLVDSTKNHESFLRLGNGCVEIVKMGKTSEARASLVPYNYDFVRAANIFYQSPLSRSSRVERILREILGISTTDIVDDGEEEVIEKDNATGTSSEVYTLAELCSELNMEPSAARKALRGKIEKPGFGWKWPNREAANLVRAILTESQL